MELILTSGGTRVTDRIDRWLEARRPKLVRIAYAVLRDHEEAEDVVQQTLLSVWDRAQRNDIINLGGYLTRSVRWNAVKRRARQRLDAPLEALGEPSAAGHAPDDRLEAFEVETAIARLPAAQQVVVRLRFYLGLSFREIGTNLSISTNTAASRTRYALANLRRVLGVQEPGSKREDSNE